MTQNPTSAPPHAVARLRDARLARSSKPFAARGGSRRAHCAGCRLVSSHCTCALRRQRDTRAGFCLLMHDIEPLKPSNTGWLIADVVADTHAFGWARTSADPALLALLRDPQWQPCVVFPAEGLAPARLLACHAALQPPAGDGGAPRPLFVLLDGTWAEARKMFRHSPWLEHLPVLGLEGGAPSRYRLRRASQDDQWCTSEVAARCLELAGDAPTAALLNAWLGLFTERHDLARQQRAVRPDSAAQRRLAALSESATSTAPAGAATSARPPILLPEPAALAASTPGLCALAPS